MNRDSLIPRRSLPPFIMPVRGYEPNGGVDGDIHRRFDRANAGLNEA